MKTASKPKKPKSRTDLPTVVSCGAVTIRENVEKSTFEVLLIQQSIFYDGWTAPKGRKKANEPAEDCAVREVFEETGINIKLVKRYEPIVYNTWTNQRVIHLWSATPIAGIEPNTDHKECEVHAVKWHDVKWLPLLGNKQSLAIKAIISDYIGLYELDITKLSLEERAAEEITKGIKLVMEYVPPASEWVDIKRELLNRLPSHTRTLFSKMHFSTSKQIPNEFEYWIMGQWERWTGSKPILTKNIHDEEAYQKHVAAVKLERDARAARLHTFVKRRR